MNGNNSLRYLEFRAGAFDFQTSQQNLLVNDLRRFLRFCVSIDYAKLLCLKAAFKGIERALIQKLFLKILILCYLD